MTKMTLPGNVVLNKKDRDLVARKLTDRLSYRRTDIADDIQRYATYLKERTASLAKVEEDVAQEAALFAEVVAKLRAARIKFSPMWGMGIEVETTKKGLMRVYKALGRLNGAMANKELFDAEKKLVKVTLPAVAYPSVQVSFLHKLTETDKCRIETETTTRTRLVCKRD